MRQHGRHHFSVSRQQDARNLRSAGNSGETRRAIDIPLLPQHSATKEHSGKSFCKHFIFRAFGNNSSSPSLIKFGAGTHCGRVAMRASAVSRWPLNELRGVGDARSRSRKTDPQLDFVQISQFRPFRSRSTYANRRVYASIVIWRGEAATRFFLMRFLSAFRNIKTRLLALVALIIVPVALITILLAAAIDKPHPAELKANGGEQRRSPPQNQNLDERRSANIVGNCGKRYKPA